MIPPSPPPNFYKGLPGFTRASEELEAHDAQDSIYYWWWRFMRISPVFWFARTTGLAIKDADVARTYELAGDLGKASFSGWWRTSGRLAFAEAKRPARVQQLDLTSLQEHQFKSEQAAIYLEVPLTIRQETIVKQFKAILKEAHAGRRLNVAQTTLAPLKLHTKRFNLVALEREYWILIYRLTNPQITLARIGDRLQISPAIKIRDQAIEVWKEKTKRPEHRLMSVTARYLMKARQTLINAERGRFPDYRKASNTQDYQPFGPEQHANFLARTATDNQEADSYVSWLRQEFDQELQGQVKKVNRLHQSLRMPDGLAAKQWPAFYAGSSDKISIR